jgi:hypothetical protein
MIHLRPQHAEYYIPAQGAQDILSWNVKYVLLGRAPGRTIRAKALLCFLRTRLRSKQCALQADASTAAPIPSTMSLIYTLTSKT